MPTTVWFHRSTMPFCCGEYGAVWCCTTLIHAVRSELHRSEFAAAISPQHAKLLAALGLHAHLELLDRHRHFVLAHQELQPHVATVIIHEQEEVLSTTVCSRRDWPIEVAVDELESILRAILGRLWEW